MSPAHIKGPIAQRELLVELKALIDAARVPNSTAHKDIARAKLRTLLETANVRTGYIGHGLGPTRCKYLASIGFWMPSKHLMREPWQGKTEPPEVSE
jgi:hypothetical protein